MPDQGLKQRDPLFEDRRVKIISTQELTPPQKRDIGIKHSEGEILAFIDDDAYPQRDWLENALDNFQDKEIAALGGPAITPGSDNSLQQASGLVYSSLSASGNHVRRYLPMQRQEVDDYPSCNFFVRKSVMQSIGGFNTNFWPGEDTKLCLDITKKLGKKIIYDPRVLVFHHRRPLYLPHLRQIANYALHRGYFAKRYPETSLKIAYFLPSFVLIAILFGALQSLVSVNFRMFYFLGIFVYLSLIVLFSDVFSSLKKFALLPYVFSGIVTTHITYGLYFIKGLLSNKLSEE